MSPETPPTELTAPLETATPDTYPFWGYLDLGAFVLIALLGVVVESVPRLKREVPSRKCPARSLS